MAQKSTRISFVTKPNKRKTLNQIADVYGMNLSGVINEALDRYIDVHEWQVKHIQEGVEAAERGEFATDKEMDRFLKKYGSKK